MPNLGKYEIVSELGRGATSTVWLANDPFAKRQVAIKVATPEALADPERGSRYSRFFINEASLVGKLSHPHIVQIYDAVVAERQSYIVMEYVQGGTLERFCKPDQLLPLQRLVEIIFKCTRALNFAYQLGVTHRDIKPANILLAHDRKGDGNDGGGADIKISDFGAAIVLAAGGVDKTIVSGVGSPAYMSPEQVRDEPLDHRTDIYSLGVVMYKLLTGQLPFQASSNYNMVYQIIHTRPTPPSKLRADLPPSLEDIVQKAMAKNLDDRYPTWEAFAQDLADAFRQRSGTMPSAGFADSEKFNTLRELPFFADFPDAELWEVVRFAHWEHIAPGHTVIRDGEPGNFFCFVADGELKVTKAGKVLNVLSHGDCFGEMAAISRHGSRRGANVIGMTDAKIISIAGDTLSKASDSCRMHFYQAFLDVMAGRLSLANARLAAF